MSIPLCFGDVSVRRPAEWTTSRKFTASKAAMDSTAGWRLRIDKDAVIRSRHHHGGTRRSERRRGGALRRAKSER